MEQSVTSLYKTVSAHVAFLPLTFAVIVTEPAFFPLTVPLLSTVAILSSEDFHATFEEASLPNTFKDKILPQITSALALSRFIVPIFNVLLFNVLADVEPLRLPVGRSVDPLVFEATLDAGITALFIDPDTPG